MNLEWLKALLVSRKFWLAFIATLVAVVLYIQGAIDAETLVNAIVALMVVLVGSIAAEDVASKLNGKK